MKLRPQQEMSYPLIGASDMKWFQEGTGTPSVIAHIVEVNFQQCTITLPEGKFDLGFFLRVAEDIHLRSL